MSNRDQSDDRDLYSGLIRLQVLHHAVEEPIFRLGMLEELARHGYRISPVRCTRSCMAWRSEATFVQPHSATANPCGRSTVPLPQGETRWKPPRAKSENCFQN